MSSRSSISCLLTTARRFLGSSSGFVTVARRIPRERDRFLFAAVFSRSAGYGGSVVFFVRVLCCFRGGSRKFCLLGLNVCT